MIFASKGISTRSMGSWTKSFDNDYLDTIYEFNYHLNLSNSENVWLAGSQDAAQQQQNDLQLVCLDNLNNLDNMDLPDKHY